MSVLISLAWLLIVLCARVREPLLTLVFNGIPYGVFAISIGAIPSSMLTDQLLESITNPFGVGAVLITDRIWGGLVGLYALAIQAVGRPAQSWERWSLRVPSLNSSETVQVERPKQHVVTFSNSGHIDRGSTVRGTREVAKAG